MNLTEKQKEVIRKIIYAVETGNQTYGCQSYSDFTEAFTNSSTEYAITIGAGQWYGVEAKRLLDTIRSTYPKVFKKLDTEGIGTDLDTMDWSVYKLSKTSAKAKCIQTIISSDEGIKCQDKLIDDQMAEYVNEAENLGVTEVDAAMMCANFRHQGGLSAVKRILAKTSKPYTLDKLYASCQTDTGNQVGAYKSRQKMVYESLKKYISGSQKGGDTMATKISPDAVIAVAKGEIGYLEKASNSSLDSKTGNAGSNNYTKYWRDMANLGIGNYQGQYWCACFVFWCFVKAFDLATAQKLLLHSFYINCNTLYNLANSKGQIYSSPKVGDVVLYYKSSQGYYHTGLVIGVSGNTFTTIEGNTSGGSTVIDNGGGVAQKTYNLSSVSAKFMRPAYTDAATTNTTPSAGALQMGSTGDAVKELQKNLNTLINAGLEVDGSFGTATYNAVVSFQRKYGLEVDGIAGTNTLNKISELLKKLSASSSTTPSSSTSSKLNKTAKWIGKVTAKSGLNVRTWAGANNPECSFSPLKYGTQVDVCDSAKASDGVKWFYIKYNGKYGFVSSQYIKRVK